MSKGEKILNWLIIIALLILCVMLFVLPKDHCDKCNFDGQTGKEWFDNYSSKCLQRYSYGQDNPNVPMLNLSSHQPYYSYP
jgi:hypothetical protein